VIGGTPTQKGFYKVTVILDDGCGQSISKEVEIPVEDLVYAITPNTEINIWFDASGSMNAVLPVLQKMQSEVLKPCLIQFFNGNGTLFDQRVKVRQYYDERAFSVLNTQGSTMAITQVINLAFSDEAIPNYHNDPFDSLTRTSYYESDITALRGTLISKPSYIRGAIFRVTGREPFLALLDAVKGSTGAYAGIYGLADQNDIRVVPNVARPGGGVGTATPLPGSPMYYGNQIIEALNSMGFTLKLCDKAQDPPVSLTPQIVSQNPLEGPTVGVPYQGVLSAVGGLLPYTWNLPTGTLPNGLTFNATTGVISGTPTTVQTANFSIKVVDTNNASDQESFSLAVTWPTLGVEWSEDTPTLTAGQPANPEVFTASGGDGNYTWSVSSGSLPPGIFLSGNSGKTVSLSGTPATAGTYNFIVKALSAGQEMNIDVSYIIELGPQPTPTPSPSPTPAPSEMVAVEGGTLPSGSGLAGQAVATFQIGKYEVTWDEWQIVRTWAVANGYSDLAGVGGTYPAGSAGNFPVVNVSWYDVVKWCNAKSEKEALTPVYQVSGGVYRTGEFGWNGSSAVSANSSANGYRLPSEAEREWAARGGLLSQGYTYSGSNDANAVAWTYENSGDAAHAIGTKAANELGIYDMSGNVFEWCDKYPNTTASRRLRGGSWLENVIFAAVANGGYDNDPDSRFNAFGFRLARSSGQLAP
jgi:formylglycine-generating enzyme required for sulfatase activity